MYQLQYVIKTILLTVHVFKISPEILSANFCNSRFISNINAVVSIVLSGYCLLLESGTREDMVWHDSPAARTACAIIVGYMFAGKVINSR